MSDEVGKAIKRAQDHLLSLQSKEGYWVGELSADVSVPAGYIPLMRFLGVEIDPIRKRRIISYIKSKQNPDGSWSTYHGGPGDLNVTIQTYFALKLAGISDDMMRKAKEFILANGGIMGANILTKIELALFGQFDWKDIPSPPPEIILLPNWFPLNIYELSSWSRATIVALLIILAKKPVCPVPNELGISELYIKQGGGFSHGFFGFFDILFKIWERLPFKPVRGIALRRAEEWILSHQEADGSWGGIMLPWVYSLIALKCLGYSLEHPVMARGISGLKGFIKEDGDYFKLQPATSPVWDTAWSLISLIESGVPTDHPSIVKAAQWLLKKEVRVRGDWGVKNPKAEPGCWSFEFENRFYPDIDDTAAVCRALLKAKITDEGRRAIDRGISWIISMQSRNGGWAAFDKDNDKRLLAHIPFSDFMTPLDPPSADVTAHVLELLGEAKPDEPSIRKAIAYLKKTQEADGAWGGRWGVNYIYGTSSVLAGLRAVGEDIGQEYIRRGVEWLLLHQNEDGGWGETPLSYEETSFRGKGPSTPSQTSWALIGLIAAGEEKNRAAERGIRYLLENQQPDGSWHEEAYTGTGFPQTFYLRYDLYRIYFPLLALSHYKEALS